MPVVVLSKVWLPSKSNSGLNSRRGTDFTELEMLVYWFNALAMYDVLVPNSVAELRFPIGSKL